jgi:hypothetical protein
MDLGTAHPWRVQGHLEVMTPGDARAVGLDGDDLRVAVRAGGLVRVRRGAYVTTDDWAGLDAAGRYRRHVLAAARALRDPVFCHDSAAALWGFPRIGAWPDDVHVLVPGERGGRSSRGVRRHVGPGCDAVQVEGVRRTPTARTLVDVARTWPFAAALVAADHVLRTGAATTEELDGGVDLAGSGRGVRAARRVVAAASASSESVGESLSRARMLDHGVPAPELQHEVRDRGRLVARVDFWWPALGLVGEFDGRLKYRAAGIADPRAVEERLWSEKLREDRLRALGLRVVRWTWDDALVPDRLLARLRSAGLTPGLAMPPTA